METLVAQPKFEVIYEGKNITQDVTKNLISVEYTDNTGNESDEISIRLEDVDGNWRGGWFPKKGDKIKLAIGYDDNILNCGTFTVDEIELQGPPDEVTIRGLAAGINSPLRSKRSRGYEKQTLRQIAQKIADDHGYTIEDSYEKASKSVYNYDTERAKFKKIYSFIYDAGNYRELLQVCTAVETVGSWAASKGKKSQLAQLKVTTQDIRSTSLRVASNPFDKASLQKSKNQLTRAVASFIQNLENTTNTVVTKYSVLDSVTIGRVTQNRETDLEFLNRIAGEYGIMFSLRDKTLVFTSIYGIEKGQSVLTFDRTELMRYSFKDKATKTYKKARLKYHNPEDSKVVSAEIQSNDINVDTEYDTAPDTLEIRIKAENKQQAEEKARAQLHKANTKNQEGQVTLIGNPTVCAGVNIVITGLGELSGKWHVKQSKHKLDKGGGYVTDAEVKRIGKPEDTIPTRKTKPKPKPEDNMKYGTTPFNKYE